MELNLIRRQGSRTLSRLHRISPLAERRTTMQKLSNAAAGRYTIKWIFVEPELRKVLSGICIDKGKIVTVVRRNPLGGILLKSEAGSFFIDSDILAGITV